MSSQAVIMVVPVKRMIVAVLMDMTFMCVVTATLKMRVIYIFIRYQVKDNEVDNNRICPAYRRRSLQHIRIKRDCDQEYRNVRRLL